MRSRPAWGLLLVVIAAGAAARDLPEIGYRQRLQMPSVEDQIGDPRAVHGDLHTGEVFVGDTRKNRILIFDRRGLYLYQIPGGEVFRAPLDVAVDPDGHLLVLARRSGPRRLFWLDFDGRFLREIRLSGLPEGSLEPDLVSAALAPAGDRIYVLDQANQRLWLTARDGEIFASVDLTADVTAKEAQEQILGRVDVYDDTVLVAVPTGGRILLFDLDGGSRGEAARKGSSPCQMMFPVAAALAADGRLLVLDQRRMILMLWDPSANRCLAEYSGFGNAPGALYLPADLALDGEGRVFVSQGFDGRVQVFAGAEPAAGAAASE